MSENQKIKKPIYKKWWFWAIIVALIIGIFGTSSNQNAKKTGNISDSNTESTSESQNTSSNNNSDNSSEENKKEEEKSEFKVGDVISFDGKEVVVTDVTRDYNTGNGYSVPKSGKEFVKVTVKIENKSKSDIHYDTTDFKMKDSSGNITYCDGPTYSLEDQLEFGQLAENGKVTGSLVFEVPKSDNNLYLIYEPSFWSNKKVEVKL